MKLARWVFLIAGLYGVVAIGLGYFFEGMLGGAPLTHPEFYYGFLGCAGAWQLAFFFIASDPVRYRPLMLAAIVEKMSFALAVLALYLGGRLDQSGIGGGIIDATLGFLFAISYTRTPKEPIR